MGNGDLPSAIRSSRKGFLFVELTEQVGIEKLLLHAQVAASDVLKRRFPSRYQSLPVISVKHCVKGLLEIGALPREIAENCATKLVLCHWFLSRIEAKDRKVVSDPSFYRSLAWRKIRFSVLHERGAKCEVCGTKAKAGTTLHVDHVKPRSKYPELALDPTNLQILCEDCNLGKADTDWGSLAA